MLKYVIVYENKNRKRNPKNGNGYFTYDEKLYPSEIEALQTARRRKAERPDIISGFKVRPLKAAYNDRRAGQWI